MINTSSKFLRIFQPLVQDSLTSWSYLCVITKKNLDKSEVYKVPQYDFMMQNLQHNNFKTITGEAVFPSVLEKLGLNSQKIEDTVLRII